MSLVPASRHLARRIGPLASQVSKRWISIQQLDDQQASEFELPFFHCRTGLGVAKGVTLQLINMHTSCVSICTTGCVFRNAMSNERNLRVVGRSTEPGSHNYSATICILYRTKLTISWFVGRTRLIVLGSGWGGFSLLRNLPIRQFQPVVISPRPYFVFTPLLASTSVGTLEPRTALESVRSPKGVEYYEASVSSIGKLFIPNLLLGTF